MGVSDGDTITVLRGQEPVKVRLYGIDCPEKSQAFGQKAKQRTSALVFGATVTVQPADIDRYGRTVAKVSLEDGRSLNEELVAGGYAWWYREYAPKDERLGRLEAGAREKGLGLWADEGAEAPWEFRRLERTRRKGGA